MTNEEAIKYLDEITSYCDFEDEYGDPIDSTPYYEALDMAIKALEQPKWIPVSERLPEDSTEVFVYLCDRPSPYIAWIEDTHWYTEDFEVERENEPVAWMPLPKPYVPDTNDGKIMADEESEVEE